MNNWYDDAPEVRTQKDESRTSRIPRRCHSCNGTINRGDKYHHSWSIVDGVPEWRNEHLRCPVDEAIIEQDAQDYMAGTGAYAESVEEDPND